MSCEELATQVLGSSANTLGLTILALIMIVDEIFTQALYSALEVTN